MRIRIFDVAKALLLIMVYWFHIPRIFIGWLHENNDMIVSLDNYNQIAFASFFMPAFFIISGYFINTQRSVKETIKRDIQTILIPMFFLSLISNLLYSLLYFYYSGEWWTRFKLYTHLFYWQDSLGLWFLTALFINKQIIQILIRYIKNTTILITISMCLCVLGLTLKNGIINIADWFHYKEALLMSPFTLFGYLCKKHQVEISRGTLENLSLGYVLSLLILCCTDGKIDGFNLGSAFSTDYVPMALWLGISGSAFIMYISSWVENSKVLNYIGKLTLPLFCLNFFFVDLFLRILKPLVDNGHAALYVFIVFVCSLGSGIIISSLLNTKYLRWSLGHFKK